MHMYVCVRASVTGEAPPPPPPSLKFEAHYNNSDLSFIARTFFSSYKVYKHVLQLLSLFFSSREFIISHILRQMPTATSSSIFSGKRVKYKMFDGLDMNL